MPGGDPLAAALAAGGTPSPEVVAAAGKQEGMPRRFAILCLAAIGICLVADIVLQSRTVAAFRTPLDNPPDVLASKARETAAAFGYPQRPADSAVWLTGHEGLLPHLNKLPKPHKWNEWLASEPPLLAVYRESSGLLLALPYGDIDTSNPPPTSSGMIQANVNGAGLLRKFTAIPSPDAAPIENAVDPSAVFRAAGLDMANFTETTPKFAPVGAADEVRSWKGRHPKIPNLDLTVDMAFWKGRVTTVDVLDNWKGDAPGVTETSVTKQVRDTIALIAAAAGVLAAILLARRNWRLGRIDRKGAVRIGIARFLLGLVIWLGTVHAVPSSNMISLAMSSLATWLTWGAAFWLLYLALEPSVRAHWPHSIVTWNRVLAGRWKDAQVGSHILIGAAVGAAVWATAGVVEYLSSDGLSGFGGLEAAIGTRHWIAFHANNLSGSLAVGLVIFFALTGLRQLVKKDLIAATLAAMIFTFFNGNDFTSSNWPVKSAVYLFIFAVLILVLLRYGLVTIIVATFFINTFDDIGVGVDWKTWYAPAGLATVALLAGIAIYGFWRSLGSSEMLDEAAG